ncbi:fasciclin domain-containing protein [Gelidibacter salicanalis]|uniref:Fasciclin domain-containing protein n=1 Tax=Gelidibacter salicanalis TaxID=291193 RepID=A0A934KKK5_9FLAO|nr:fasciclin domain-containing protein [Gelidibacter salicanalis]MBJ7880792.1 fasciclin domain-containing protein [Gelidibacter salicanalis]
MIFKKTSILFAAALTAFVFVSSCEDGKKKEEQMRMETERVEMEAAEEARMEMEAEEARMKEEARANSIAGQAMKNEELTTLVSALQSAELATMLSEPGEYTVFAPSNQAFEKLTQKKRDELMKPENKQMLTDVLTYHVVKGAITSDKFAEAIKGANGSYKFKTVKGDELTAMMNGDQFVIKDATGKKAQVILGNVEASNGRIYIIDTVLMSKK